MAAAVEPSEEPQLKRVGQEGGRWVNCRPAGEEIARWFEEDVFVHDGLDHKDYVNGVTLIQAIEKSKNVGGVTQDGAPVIVEVEDIVWVPYMRVDTRVRYWHDLLEKNPDWFGTIEPVEVAKSTVEGTFNTHLPPGFFMMPIRGQDGKVSNFIGMSMRARIYKREGLVTRQIHSAGGEVEQVVEGELVLDAPPATKVVNTATRWGADENALMKAETGAVGRALGMAGILVLGGGIATAEDVLEARNSQGVSVPDAPEVQAADITAEPMDAAAMREKIVGLTEVLKQDDPEKLAQFQAWHRERQLPILTDCNEMQLKAVMAKLERGLAQ